MWIHQALFGKKANPFRLLLFILWLYPFQVSNKFQSKSLHIENWHHSCSGFFQNWFIFSIYWILYVSIIAGGSSSLEFNGLEVIFKLKGPETDILLGSWNKIENCLSTYFWDHHMIEIEITQYPIKTVTYPFGIGHIEHEGMCWNIKVFFVCFDPTSLCHMLHPSAPNIPISTDLWPHFSYCATFHSHILKFGLYGNT